MPFGVKEEKYEVVIKDGKRYLRPKTRETEEILAKRMGKHIKREGKSERTPEQNDSEHIKAMEKAYRQREKAKKLKEKERRKKEWAKIKYAIGKTQRTSREGMSLSMYGKKRPTKSTGSRGGKNYTIVDGTAYPIYRKKKKKKKKDKFSWDDFSMDDKDFKMPKWGDMF